ncbi:hypothetical protein FB451DRAFT_1469686 [Mycena latifolia]|nr:hypothetical protein FB451DRAFT_1469686 [Mycena latifolia]
MASLASTVPTAQLCDYCHQKPKHGTHPYCSKTCAAQTATLCNYCLKKPKYQNFDFCGKNCAALAAAAAPPSGNRAANAPASVQAQATTKPAGRASGNAAAPQAQAPAANPLLDPVHLAKLVVQHIPQVQSFLAAVTPAQPAAPAPVSASVPVPAPAPAPANPQSKPRNNPFLNQPPASNAPATAASGTAAPSAAPQAPPPVQPLDCLIPGCGKPVHVDGTGVMSDYCSKKHREEAVSSGLVSPCIMCLTLPQSDTDYFCGRDCREEAMNKSLVP